MNTRIILMLIYQSNREFKVWRLFWDINP